MTNTLTNVLPRLLAQGLLALRQNAILPRLVNRDYQNLAAQKGNVINVPIPSAITARDVTAAVTFAANQDNNPTTAAVTLDFWKEASFHLSDNDLVSAMNGVIPMQASEAIKSLANAVDAYIIGKAVGIYGWVGAAGTTPFASGVTVLSAARTLLNKQLAPLSDRSTVLDPAAEGALLIASPVLLANERGDQGAVISGTIGRKLGFDHYMDQNIATFTPGAAWVTGYTVSVSNTVGVSTMVLLNSTATGAVKIGDVFTIGGATNQQYVLTAVATVASSVLTVFFKPDLVTHAATADVATVVATAHVINLAMHRDAFAWASRPLADIQGLGNQMMSAVDDISGIALRLEVSRQYKQTTFSYDILGGANLVRRELAVRIMG